jgi:hypothetical protein
MKKEHQNLSQGQWVALLSYCWIPGWIIAALINQNKHSEFGIFHLRQGLGLLLLTFILFFVVRFRLIVVGIYLVFAVLGISSSLSNKLNGVPVFGNLFDSWFKSL